MTNKERAARAMVAMRAYDPDINDANEEALHDGVADLIADLLHLAYIQGFDVSLVNERALSAWKYERDENERW